MPAPLFALVGKLALGLEFLLQPVTPYDIGLDRVLVHRAQQHEQQQFDIVRFWLIDRARRTDRKSVV